MPGRIGELAALLVCLGLGLLGWAGWATPVDPAAIPVLQSRAEELAGSDLGADAWLDVAKACSRLRPWHSQFGGCRTQLAAIDEARR
jgi:hypothetical protein